MGRTQVNLKLIPDVDGTPAIAQLVAYNLCDIQVKGVWSDPARLHLVAHVKAPLADLPVRKVHGGLFHGESFSPLVVSSGYWRVYPRRFGRIDMNNIVKGVLGGLVGTVVMSALMLMKSAMGLMPQLDVIHMLSGMMGVSAAIAWVIHFMIGAIWGALFALSYRAIPGASSVVKGMLFGVGAWLLMMVMVMPMAGAGFFGMVMGVMAPMMTLLLHIIFGAVMGLVYGKENRAV